MPGGGKWTGLGLAVADDGRDEQVGVVEGGTVRVRQRVAEFAALVDGTRRLGCRVARDAAREGELPEQPAQPVLGVVDRVVDLGVRAVQVGVGDHSGATVARAGDEDRVQRPFPDDTVQVRVDEVEPGRRAPVAEEARLDVVAGQRRAQERVVEQVDLPDRKVVGGAPPRIQLVEGFGREFGSCSVAPRGRRMRRCRSRSPSMLSRRLSGAGRDDSGWSILGTIRSLDAPVGRRRVA